MKILHATRKGYHVNTSKKLILKKETNNYNQLNANIVSSLMQSLTFCHRTKKKPDRR
jgi:hypothetical protein